MGAAELAWVSPRTEPGRETVPDCSLPRRGLNSPPPRRHLLVRGKQSHRTRKGAAWEGIASAYRVLRPGPGRLGPRPLSSERMNEAAGTIQEHDILESTHQAGKCMGPQKACLTSYVSTVCPFPQNTPTQLFLLSCVVTSAQLCLDIDTWLPHFGWAAWAESLYLVMGSVMLSHVQLRMLHLLLQIWGGSEQGFDSFFGRGTLIAKR